MILCVSVTLKHIATPPWEDRATAMDSTHGKFGEIRT